MSRLILLTSLTALTMAGGGAGGLALSRTTAEPAVQPRPAPAPPRAEPAKPRSPDTRPHLRAGESLAQALLRSGVGGLDAALAEQALADRPLAQGRPLRLWLGPSLPGGARRLNRLEVRSTGGLIHVLERREDAFTSTSRKVRVDDTPVRLRLEAGPALARELHDAGLPSGARALILARAQAAGAESLDLIIAHEEVAGDMHYGPPLYLAVTFPSGEVRRWLGDEEGRLEPLGTATKQTGLKRPVPGPVSSTVGMRFHPVLRFFRWHRGTDFAAHAGTPVQAAAGGRVIDAGWRGGYGKLVRLAHDDGTVSVYAHLSLIDTAVGEHVAQGAILGLVGDSGLATGPHLHFEWLRGGQALQPAFAPALPTSRPLDRPTRMALQDLLAAPYRSPPAIGS